MILKEFSKYLQENETESSIKLLNQWIIQKLENPAQSNVDRIIQAEIYLAKNKYGDSLLIAKDESGRILIKTLYNFSMSFEQQKLARWLHNKKPDDFKNC